LLSHESNSSLEIPISWLPMFADEDPTLRSLIANATQNLEENEMIRDITRAVGIKAARLAVSLSPTIHRRKAMKISKRPLLAALVLSVGGFSIANSAQAGCGFAPPLLKPSAWNSSTQTSPTLLSAVYRPGAEGRFLLTGGVPDEAGIVGMWQFQLLAPNGAVVDDGYAQWHSDGTEIQNTGMHAPITSNFCLGVWKQVGFRTYQLNHFPLAWDASGQSPANA